MKTRFALLVVFLVGGCGGAAPTSSSLPDAGPDADSLDGATAPPVPDSCGPHAVPTFTPSGRVPHQPESACTAAEVDLLFSNWYQGTYAERMAFERDHAACFACAVSPETASGYGPLVHHANWSQGRQSACFLSLDRDDSAAGCAARFAALEECEWAACNASCPVRLATDLDALIACYDNAIGTACLPYANATVRCLTNDYADCATGAYASDIDWMRPFVTALCAD